MALPLAMQLNAEFQDALNKADSRAKQAQDFFAAYAAELLQPHYGDAAKIFAQAMLRRAEEVGLYVAPKAEEAKQ